MLDLSQMKTVIVDYNLGNIRSVYNAFLAIGSNPKVSRDHHDILAADKIILPGVGAFGDGMENLYKFDLVGVLTEAVIQKKKPFLGFCIGMQLLATEGFEHGTYQGLNWISGKVEKIDSQNDKLRVPHIGWNDVEPKVDSKIFQGLGQKPCFYFANSYVFHPADKQVVSAQFDYGHSYTAALEYENIYATQFHPEKSQKAGLMLLKNFLEKV